MKTLQACHDANPHGAGVAFRRGGRVVWQKTNSVREVKRIADAATGDVVIHFRIASVGGVCDDLRHPFPVSAEASLDASGEADSVLFQNGTWVDWRSALAEYERDGGEVPGGEMSDARAAAVLVAAYGEKILSDAGPSRWVIFGDTTKFFGKWFKLGEIYFSNLFWAPRGGFGSQKSTPRTSLKQPAKGAPARPVFGPSNAPATPARVVTAPEAPKPSERELWDLSGVGSYWDKVGKGPRPVRKH